MVLVVVLAESDAAALDPPPQAARANAVAASTPDMASMTLTRQGR